LPVPQHATAAPGKAEADIHLLTSFLSLSIDRFACSPGSLPPASTEVCLCASCDGGDGGGWECSSSRRRRRRRSRAVAAVLQAEEDGAGHHGPVRARQERRRGGGRHGNRSRVRRQRQQGVAAFDGTVDDVARGPAAAARLPRRLPRDNRPGTPPPPPTHTHRSSRWWILGRIGLDWILASFSIPTIILPLR
jgi:hypothetical protein